MGAYGKMAFADNGKVANETVTENFNNTSVVDEQVNKFDNSYATQEKLQELYNEFDKITIDEDKLATYTQVETNVVSQKVPFRVVLTMTTISIVTLLLAFLCIYNIFVINGISSSITYLQEEVTVCEYDLASAQGLYEGLTSTENIQSELSAMGYGEIASSNIVAVSVPEQAEVESLQGQTNWFDAFCNFISRIFG